jgi:hypothetical protein
MGLVRAIHLIQWAMTHDARIKIGELLRKLIHASIPLSSIRGIRFLANESTQLKGWDGLLDCDSEVTWVPNGTSVWELGTGADPRDKIRTDFQNRLKKDLPLGCSKDKTTYVAVTIRSLDNLIEIENELKQNSPWRDVRIYDATTMEDWVAQYPSIAAWLQEQGVGPSPSIHTLKRYWQLWSDVTQPTISPELILADRDKDASGLRNALKDSGGIINIQADSPDEAVAFVFSALNTDETELRERFLAKSIVIRTKDDADRMRDFTPHYVVLVPPATEKAQVLTRYNHTVINALGNSSLTQRVDFRLKRSLRSSFTETLSKMGMTKKEAEVEARACGASPSVWRVWNLLNRADLSEIPIWGGPDHANIVIPAVLIGGWSDKFEGDKEIIKAISGYDFETYTELLHPFLSTDNPFLVKIADAWVATAPTVAFALLINQITFGHLEKLSKVASDVFTEIDPTIDLAPDDRAYAAIKTAGMRHSIWLRDGLAETLLRIVVLGERLERTGAIAGNQSCQSYVDQLIRNLPGLREDWRLLASLRSQLPVLAEAAPFPFLEALECLLQGTPEKILPIFAEGEGTLGGHAFHPHFLWALETLAWEPSLLARVGLILAGLAKIDPQGRVGNRPINSLREIFLAWHPGTSANLEQRLQVLDLIIKRYPDIGWTLLMALMPKSHDTSSPTNEPKWKDFGRSQREPLTRSAIWITCQHYIDRALFHAGSEPNRWIELIGIYSEVSESHRQAIEDGFRELANIGLAEDAKNSIWETIRNFLNLHRGYPDAFWALPEDRLGGLEAVMDLFTPHDQIDRISWLFNDHFPDIPFPKQDLDEVDIEIKKLRNEAVEKLWREGGLDSLIIFLDNIAFPGLVSIIIIDLLPDTNEILKIFEETNQASNNQREFAKGLSGQALKHFGDRWTDLILQRAAELNWPADAIVNAIEQYPDSLKTFELVASLGPEVEKRYWELRHSWVREEDDPSFKVSVNKLLLARRALDVVALPQKKLAELGTIDVIRIIDQVLEELNEGKSPIRQNIGYYIGKLLDWLRDQDDIEKAEIARREYAFLPLLTRFHDQKQLALHELLANDANFFVDVLCDLYKASSGQPEEEQISEDRRRRAKFAWDLLRSWHTPPGIEEDEQVNGEKLREWVEIARLLAKEKDRAVIADQHIGKILYYFPSDPNDFAWPHIELRKLLEDLQSNEVEKGIQIEQFSARGVYSKALFEGGVQERELAKKWLNWAEIIGLRWPRTRAMLERIAASWEANAKREDESAEKDRHRFG